MSSFHSSPLGFTVAEYMLARGVLYAVIPVSIGIYGASGASLINAIKSALYGSGTWSAVAGFVLALLACTAFTVFAAYLLRETVSMLNNVRAADHSLWILNSETGRRRLLSPPEGVTFASVGAWEVAETASEALRARVVLRPRYVGRLGNNVFQYATARIRAAVLDVAFEAAPLDGPFGGVDTFVDRWSAVGDGAVRHAALLRPRDCCAIAGAASLAVGRRPGLRKAACACPALPEGLAGAWAGLAEAEGRLHLSGDGKGKGGALLAPGIALHSAVGRVAGPSSAFTMSVAWFVGWEGLVAAWLRPSLQRATQVQVEAAEERGTAAEDAPPSSVSSSPLLSFGPRDVALHVRVGDIAWGVHAAYAPLPHSFYRRALALIAQGLEVNPRVSGGAEGHGAALGTLVIVTESPHSTIVAQLAAHLRELAYDVETGKAVIRESSSTLSPLAACVRVQSSSLDGDLATLASAPAVVLSVSSFAWWPAALGAASNVIVPAWGLLHPHEWAPDAVKAKGVTVRHDLRLPPFPPASPTEEEEGGAALPPPAAVSWVEAVCVAERADGLAWGARIADLQGPLEVTDSGVPGRTVTYLRLPAWGRWPGNTHDAVASLRD
jgi:hypothetical protein